MTQPARLRLPLLAAAACLAFGAGRLASSVGAPTGAAELARAQDTAAALSLAFQEVAGSASRAVISVEAEAESSRRPGRFRRLAQGSGAILSADGLAVTNHHVVRGCDRVRATLFDGTEVAAELVGVDRDADLAVLRIAGEGHHWLPYAEDDEVEVGRWVLAMGNPYGYGHTVTTGIVSGLGRTDLNISAIERFVQTDAAINPGNSGGPLIDLDGKLIGINTAVGTERGGNLGIGFAIPASLVREIVAEILEDGAPRRGWLGVTMGTLSSDASRARGLDGDTHVIVSEVLAKSPAAGAGVAPGDVILSIGGARVTTQGELLNVISDIDPGTLTRLVVDRDGETLALEVRLDDRSRNLPAEDQ